MAPAPRCFAAAAAAAAVVLRGARAAAPYCMPTDPCWPAAPAWVALNASVGGRLVAPLPVGQPCYTQGPTSPACQAVIASWADPFWRASQPGAMQAINWEEDAAGGSCYNPLLPCTQGDIPPVGVAAAGAADVAAALAFAAAHNIRVVVKSSGHDYQGRSTAPGALLVWMHGLRGIDVDPGFAPCAGDAPAPAVTTRPGNGWGEVYAAVSPAHAVVGGSALTVSSAGGYTLGGGHSFMSPSAGLAVDNARAFTAVLANGTAVLATACENPDLFWALRGGGGGSFAVVTSATYALYPPPPQGVAGGLIVVAFLRGATSVATWWAGILGALPGLQTPDAARGGVVWGGYFEVGPTYASMTVVANGTVAAATASSADLVAFLQQHPADFLILNLTLTPFPTMDAWHRALMSGDPRGTDPTGSSVMLGSRLVPAAACTDPAARAAAVSALTNVSMITGMQGLMVAGGAVAAADASGAATSVTPAWRAALLHVVFGAGWDNNATLAQQQAVTGGVSALAGELRAAMPGSGAYVNEADFLEPSWQDAFWGTANYARLQGIKARVDPTGIFTCHHCVELP